MLLFAIYILSVVSQIQSILGHWLVLCGIGSIIIFVSSYFTSFNFNFIKPAEDKWSPSWEGYKVTTVDGKTYDGIHYISSSTDNFNPLVFSKMFKNFLATFKYWMIIPLILYGLAPSERTQYIMLGTYVAQATVEKIEGSTIMDKVGKIIEVKLDEIVSKDLEAATEKQEDKK